MIMGQSNSQIINPSDNISGFGFSNDGTTFGVQQQSMTSSTSTKFRHPWAVTFHLLFKLISILIYLFGSWFSSDFLGLFVSLVFLISIDFWLVKNITGRLLVGLRWWNFIDDDGQSHWIFENRATMSTAQHKNKPQSNHDDEFSLFNSNHNNASDAQSNFSDQSSLTGSDSTVFWLGLFLFTLFWFFSLLSAIFSFNIHWMLLVAIALVLSGSNLFGYIRCRFGSSNEMTMSSMIGQYVGPRMFFNMMRNVSSSAMSSNVAQSPTRADIDQQNNLQTE